MLGTGDLPSAVLSTKLPVVQVTQVHCIADIMFRHLLMLVLPAEMYCMVAWTQKNGLNWSLLGMMLTEALAQIPSTGEMKHFMRTRWLPLYTI